METIRFYGAKGGVGTTVAAAALAVATDGTLISSDGAIALGVTTTTTTTFGDGPTIVDCGVATVGNLPVAGDGAVLVTSACYMALRRMMPLDRSGFRGVVVVTEPGRALDARDVSRVLDLPVLTTIARDPAIARSVDAGLLGTRMPFSLRREVLELDAVTV